jgi:pilus assembly protein CpaE
LHNEDTRTTLVDGNFQFGDVAVFINEQGKNTIIDLATRVNELDPEIVEGVMIKHIPSGVHVLAAPSRPEHAEKVTGDQFGQLIDYLRQLYAYIVIDTTPALNDITLTAIDKSNAIVLVTTQDIPSIKNARLFLDNLKQPVAAVIPLDERVVVPAVNRGVPFVLDNKTQPASRGILALAGSVRETLAAAELSESEAVK